MKKRDKRVIEKQLELQKLQKEKDHARKLRQLQLEKEKQEQVLPLACMPVSYSFFLYLIDPLASEFCTGMTLTVIQEFELAITICYPVCVNLNLLESGNVGPVYR